MKTENITSEKRFLQAESAYQTAMATYNGLRRQLEILNISLSKVEAGQISSVVTIYAPIAGSVTKVNVSRGTYVSPAAAILEIVDNDHIHLELSVYEKDIMKLKKGQSILFKIPESSDQTFSAEVHLIGTAIEANRTIKVHGHLENEGEANFLTGMYVDAQIETSSERAMALPETAIISKDKTNLVLKLDKETEEGYFFKLIPLVVGNSLNGYVSIQGSDQISVTDKILTKGGFNLVTEE